MRCIHKAEELLGIESMYTAGNLEWPHLIDNALKAHHLYQKDKQYAVMRHPESGEMSIIIIDEFTGRLMIGRQWSDGLHQAVEAKHARDGVKIKEETQTLATITLQNYFKLYKKLSGMTGTAMTEANEFWKIYNLEVFAIPTNKPLIRINHPDVIFRTEKEKWGAAVEEVVEVHRGGRPILIGTTDVDKSIKLSDLLKRRGIKHELLNALPEHAARESEIVAQAGRIGAVTIATNMAGRGTDIILGGNPEPLAWARLKDKYASRLDVPEDEWKALVTDIATREKMAEEGVRVKEQGGLHILGTERHDARRIDNQLRGRSGRQGDPGSSRFYLSLQDDLLRIFGGERMQNLMLRLGMEEDVPIESRLITKRIAKAQEAVEARNFESRKHLLEYDDVNNAQRKAVYGRRRQLLEGIDQKESVMEMVQGIIEQFVQMRCPEDKHPDTWDLATLRNDILSQFGVKIDLGEMAQMTRQELVELIMEHLRQKYQEKEDLVGPDIMRHTERIVMLQVIDNQWKDHLLSMDELKQGIGNRAYGQKDPLVEYKKESYELFTAMMDRIEDETVRYLFFLQVQAGAGPVLPYPEEEEEESVEEEPQKPGVSEQQRQAAKQTVEDFTRNIQRKKEKELADLNFAGGDGSTAARPVNGGAKVGRNDPCPCGSGKKYKKCHGANS